MLELAIIGGTGLTSLKNLKITHREVMHTPYGEPSAPLVHGILSGKKIVFLPRHGPEHTIPPHMINYRANLWVLKQIGVQKIIAVAAVGGIRSDLVPESLVIPHQIVDYTWGRGHSFFEGRESGVKHIDFTHPYSESVRKALIESCNKAKLAYSDHAVYGATPGPRLETAAEIDRMERDGCDIVGMTGMPETALARELELDYATCALVVNMAAGRGPGDITMAEIEQHIKAGMDKIRLLLEQVIPLI